MDYRAILDAIDASVILLNEDWKVIYCNFSFTNMTGVELEDIEGHPVGEFLDELADPDLKAETDEHDWENGSYALPEVFLNNFADYFEDEEAEEEIDLDFVVEPTINKIILDEKTYYVVTFSEPLPADLYDDMEEIFDEFMNNEDIDEEQLQEFIKKSLSKYEDIDDDEFEDDDDFDDEYEDEFDEDEDLDEKAQGKVYPLYPDSIKNLVPFTQADNILNYVPGIIWTLDKNLVYTFIGGTDFSKLGASQEDIIGKSITEIMGDQENDDESIAGHNNALKGESVVYERERNGHFFRVYLNPMTTADEEITGVIGIAMDISSEVVIEKSWEELQEQFQEAEQFESLGALAGGIAHDFNNLLGAMLGAAELASISVKENTQVLEYLGTIKNSALRGAEIARNLMAYGGVIQSDLKSIDLSSTAREFINELESDHDYTIKIKYDLIADLPLIEADIDQLKHIFVVVYRYLEDILPGCKDHSVVRSGKIRLKDSDLKKCLLRHSLFDTRKYIFLEFSCEIPDEEEMLDTLIIKHLQAPGEAGGMGLSSIMGILNNMHGKVLVDKDENNLISIKLLFPNPDEAEFDSTIAVETVSELLDSYSGSEATILVVDDEEAIRRVLINSLESVGFNVMDACDGQEAVNLYRREFESIDLVILDNKMPVLSGEEAFKQMLTINPEVKVILSSGYSRKTSANEEILLKLKGFVQKPYHPLDMIKIVKETLECCDDK